MSGFLYYAPNKCLIHEKNLPDYGLDHLMSEGELSCREVVAGPDGRSGCIFTVIMKNSEMWPLVGYFPDRQEWRRFGKYWVGIDQKCPPDPMVLFRENLKVTRGYDVKLGDGREWFIMIACLLDGTSPLPHKRVFDGAKWVFGGVKSQYQKYYDEAKKFAEAVVQSTGPSVTVVDESNLAAMAISMSYRIGPAEMSMLELLDDETVMEVCKAAIDLPVLEDAIKKKLAQNGQSSDCGSGE